MRYLLYARVSDKGSTWASSETSVATQLRLCRDYAKLHGGEVVGEVVDEFRSGKDLDRPGMVRVLAELESGAATWDALLFYRLDRLSRSLKDFIHLATLLQDHGKGFVSLHESMDFTTPTGRAMLYIFSVFAQWEREMTGQRTRDKMISIARSGCWATGIVPLGYVRRGPHDNQLVVEPRGAEMVRGMFRDYLAGASAVALRDHLGRGRYSVQSVLNILRNPVYLGKVRYAGETYRGRHEPIVDQEVFDAVQARLPGARSRPRINAQVRTNLLTGLIFCGCGCPMTTKFAQHNGKTWYYYTCPDRKCRSKPMRSERAEEAVLSVLRDGIPEPGILERIVAENHRLRDERRRKVGPESTEVRAAIGKATRERATLEANFSAGAITPENAPRLNERLATIARELEALELRRVDLAAVQDDDLGPFESVPDLQAELGRVRELLRDAEADPIRTRGLIQGAVLKVVKTGDESLDVLVRDHLRQTQGWPPGLVLAQLILPCRLRRPA